MRTFAAGLTLAAAVTAWSLPASAQLQPPPPMQAPPPGTSWGTPPPQPAWGQPPPAWGVPPPGAPPTTTQQQLNAADSATSFRGFEIAYANAEVGGAYASLGMPSYPHSVNYPGPQAGLAFGAGVGIRFLTWTVGLRARVAPLSEFTLIQANLEAGFHLPLGAWDPYVGIHGGYVTAPIKNAVTVPDLPAASVQLTAPHGFDLGGTVGADYYFSALLSLGVDATADALFLSHGDVSDNAGTPVLIIRHGESSTGVAVIGALHLGLHFDL